MSNLFQEVLTDAKGVEQRLLGTPYEYWKQIKLPSEIGMSSNGSLNTLGKDIDGLIQYVEVLVTGNSNASSTGGPLGNKFFLQTGAKCKDVQTSNLVDRYVYIDNVPEGNIPFISSGLGVNFSEFKGLIPGTISNLNVLNPFSLLQSFMSGSNPDCQAVTLETIDVNNNKGTETQFVTIIDQQNMDPCSFPNRVNPVTNAKCRETFNTKKQQNTLPKDVVVQFFFASIALLGIYILYCLMLRKSRV